MVLSQAALAKEVLAEIPEQFLSYMKKRNIKPKLSATAPPWFLLPVQYLLTSSFDDCGNISSHYTKDVTITMPEI